MEICSDENPSEVREDCAMPNAEEQTAEVETPSVVDTCFEPENRLDPRDFMDGLSDDDIQMVKDIQVVIPVQRPVTRKFTDRDSDNEGDLHDVDLMRGLASKRFLVDQARLQENQESDDDLLEIGGPDPHMPRNHHQQIAFIAEQAFVAESGEPLTFMQAMQLPDNKMWLDAADAEINSLIENDTWELVPLPKGRKPIGTKWVFKRKYKADGTLDRYKARLVCTGYTQKYGIDYEETFAPVVRPESIRLLVATAASAGAAIHHMDVTTAFLNGKLTEEIYVKQPKGYIQKGAEDKVYRLKKSLYGLKQAPLCWNIEIDSALKNIGFKRNRADHGMYVRGTGNSWIAVALYVDDLLVVSADKNLLSTVKSQLASVFKMKDLGPVEYYLGMKITKTDSGYTLNQSKYIGEILDHFSMKDCNTAQIPMAVGTDLGNATGPAVDETKYRSLVGKLLYAANYTRPDISFAVSILSRYLNQPKEIHLKAAKHVLRYLRSHADM